MGNRCDETAGRERRRSPIHRADARDRVVVADAVGKQALANLPREHGYVLRLVTDDCVDDFARRHLRFAASDDSRFDRPSVVVSAAGDPLSGADTTRTHTYTVHTTASTASG